MTKFTVQMPYHPDVSINHCYGQNRGRKYMKPHVRDWQVILAAKVANELIDNEICPQPGQEVRLRIDCHFPKQRGRKPDPDNFIKVAQDAIAGAMRIDDHTFLSGIRKRQEVDGDGYFVYEIEVMENERPNPTHA